MVVGIELRLTGLGIEWVEGRVRNLVVLGAMQKLLNENIFCAMVSNELKKLGRDVLM